MIDIRPSQRNVIAGTAALVAAVGIGIVTGAVAAESEVPLNARAAVGAFGGLLCASLLASAWRLLARRGGLKLDPDGRRLGIGLTGERDIWWLDLDAIGDLHVAPVDVRLGEEPERTWVALLALHDGAPLLLGESDDYEAVLLAARRVGDALEREVVEGRVPPIEPAGDRRVRFSVRRGGAMTGLLLLLGAALTVVGCGLFTQMATFPVFALFFAPVMALTGVSLLGVVAVKRFALEELTYQRGTGQPGEAATGTWTHNFRFGKRIWAARTVIGDAPEWRVRLQGMRGARLELVGEDGILLMAAGATTRSRADAYALTQMPLRFASAHPPDAGSSAPPPA